MKNNDIKKIEKLATFRRSNNIGLLSETDYDEHFKHEDQKSYMTKLKEEINESVMKRDRYLFINRINNKVHGICSHCNTRTTLKKVPKNLSEHICEECKSSLQVRNVKYASYNAWTPKDLVYFTNSTMDENIIVAYAYRIVRYVEGQFSLDTNGISIRDQVEIMARYYFDMYSACRMMTWSEWQKTWYMRKSIFQVNSNCYIGCNEKSLLNALKKSKDFKYLQLKLIEKSDPIALLELYCKYPDIEKLEKIGLENLIVAKTLNQKTHGCINWRGKTIQKILKLNKNEIKFLINNTDKSYAELFVIQKIKSFKYNLSEEFEHGFKLADTLYGNNAKKLVFDEILSIDKPSRIRKYLETQINKNKKSYWGLGIALNDFVDMINDMKKLNMPTDKRNIYPKNLNKTHLEISELVKIEGDKLKNDLISRRLIELKNYEVEANGFIVFPARSVEDLINESKELKHCVKSYADKYVDGKTNIFFLRKKDNKEKSLYTIEVSNDLKIIQCRGKQNLSFGTEDLEMKLALDAFKLKLSKKPRRKNHEHRIAN